MFQNSISLVVMLLLNLGLTFLLNLLGVSSTPGKGTIQNLQSITDTKEPKPDEELQQACRKLCGEFTEHFKPELGCLKDFQLEIKFKAESNPTFCKPRPVPFAILDDLNQAYDAGYCKGRLETNPIQCIWNSSCPDS